MVECNRYNVAVVGAGIAGITAAHYLSKKHSVTLFERNEYIGGHTNTRLIQSAQNTQLPIDTGFIVCNSRNYPTFYKFLSELGVALRNSDMSFGFSSETTPLRYVGPGLSDFFSVPSNFLRSEFVSMLFDRARFNKRILKDLHNGALGGKSLGEYLAELRCGDSFVNYYLTPLIASIWSSSDVLVEEFPVETFAHFFNNHGMLELNKRPQWQTVVGGSHQYITAFLKSFPGRVVKNARISKIDRQNGRGIAISFDNQPQEHFDRVVIATHADEACSLLGDLQTEERDLLGTWRYSSNRAVLHTDASVLPIPKRLWASWNYRQRNNHDTSAPVAITYYMNRLQGITSAENYFVTLNPQRELTKGTTLYEVTYTHPIFTESSVRTQQKLRALNGRRNTYFCGAYLGYGFHEDAAYSAIEVATHPSFNGAL